MYLCFYKDRYKNNFKTKLIQLRLLTNPKKVQIRFSFSRNALLSKPNYLKRTSYVSSLLLDSVVMTSYRWPSSLDGV